MSKFNSRLLATIASLAICGSVQAAVIGFEGSSAAGNPIITSYSEAGFQFTSGHMHLIDPNSGFASNGTQSLGEEAGNLGQTITMSLIGGGTFSLQGLDVAEIFIGNSTLYPNATSLHLIGNLFGGGTVTADLGLDGILDGPGGADDYQTFTLSGFSNITSVVFEGFLATGARGGYMMDNLLVNNATVPEPGTLALVLLALAGATAGTRRKNWH